MHTAVASISVLILGCCALWQATDGLAALTTEGARRLNVAMMQPDLPDLVLEDMGSSEIVLGGPGDDITFAEFIYTTCPTICRAAGEEMAQLRNRLADLGFNDHVRLISVSFDPAHDDPVAMAEYGELHGADGLTWTIARPRADDLHAMLDSFGVQVIPDGFGGYEHNAALHLVDRKGRLTRIFDIDDIDGAVLAAEAYR